MNKLWLLLLLVIPIPYQSIDAQKVKHAPTVKQCRADQQLWLSKLEEPGTTSRANVSYLELVKWDMETDDCVDVDPNFELRYRQTQCKTGAERLNRFFHFIDRHNLLDQFIAEDEHGDL